MAAEKLLAETRRQRACLRAWQPQRPDRVINSAGSANPEILFKSGEWEEAIVL